MKRLLLFALLTATTIHSHAQLVINELMQSNIDCVMDDLNDFPDSWVELYNSGTGSVNLSQYKLGAENDAAGAWKLPNVTLGAKQHIVIYCDKVGSEATNGLHTDFRLDSGKGAEVWLFQGTTVTDKVTGLKKQPAPNIAYGRKTDGADTWGYQLTPTPGAANCGQTTKDILGEPVFSQTGSVIKQGQSIQLKITLPEGSPAGTVIRYTVNGTEPTATSTTIEAGSTLTIKSNRVIRAKLFCDGYLSPRSTVHSYIFFPTSRELTLPVISIVTDNKYLNDSKIGIYSSSYTNGKHNYEYDWRRPINLEYFEGTATKSILNQLCEARIMGGATRGNSLKSLAIYANKRFGTKRFEYEFFPDQRPGITDFKSLALRNAGNDFDGLYLRDPVMQRTMAQHVDLDWQAWRPAIVYINGTYKGLLNIRERSNEDNIYSNYDGLEDLDMFENWWELKEGTWDNYNAFKTFYEAHGHTLSEYAEWMDWEEFLNLMIMNLYYNNQDFPGNNIVMWRPRAEGGKWRWIAKDTDFGLGLYNKDASFNSIAWVNDNNYDPNWANWANGWEHTRLFRRMMEDPDLRREFVDRCAIYMGDFLNEAGTRAVWDPMYEMIKTEYPYHKQLYYSWVNYENNMNEARNWLKQRTNHFYQHVKNYYNLGSLISMTINMALTESDLQQVDILFNGIRLSKGIFNGMFYAGQQVRLTSKQVGNKQVTGWHIVFAGSTPVIREIDGPEYTFTMPANCSQVIINAKLGEATAIQPVSRQATADNDRWFTIDGKILNGQPTRPGTYLHQGKKVMWK